MVFLAIPMMIVSSMFVPALKSVLSKIITEDEIGKIFGLSAFGETFAGLVGALMFTSVYGASVYLWKGVAFILEAVVNVGVFLVVLWLARKFRDLLTVHIGVRKDAPSAQVSHLPQTYIPPDAHTDEFTSAQYEESVASSQQQQRTPPENNYRDERHESAEADRLVDQTRHDDTPQLQPSYGY